MIIRALETCCREGELLGLLWADVSLGRGEIVLRAERTKDRETRIIPISSRLRAILQMRGTDPAGTPFPPSARVFGDEVGRRAPRVGGIDADSGANLPRLQSSCRADPARPPASWQADSRHSREITESLRLEFGGARRDSDPLAEAKRRRRRVPEGGDPVKDRA